MFLWYLCFIITCICLRVSFLPYGTQLSEAESGFGLHLWYNGETKWQRVHIWHSTTPLAAFEPGFVRKSDSGSRSIERGWDDMIVLGHEEPHNCVHLHNVRQSEWDQMMRKTGCVFHCMTGWYNMRSIYPKVSRIHTLHRLGHLHYPCISVRPHPLFSLSALYCHAPIFAKSSAKLSGVSGEKPIYPVYLQH